MSTHSSSHDQQLRGHTDRLAQLLADQTGAQVLAELQRLMLRMRPGDPISPAGESHLGAWCPRPQDGGVALHRVDDTSPGWAQTGDVPPAGTARRVVLLGESAARGWPYDPAFNCALVLGRNLAAVRPGDYQCVDLARTGASAADLDSLAARLSLAAPDVVVSFVGNNWALFNWTLEQRDEEIWPYDPSQIPVHEALVQALRDHGYRGMRDVLASATLARAQRFLDRLATLHDAHGTRIIVVIPEFNLVEWEPTAGVEAPVLPPADLARWYELHDAAVAANRATRWAEVGGIAAKMRGLDGGTSPIPAALAGRAAITLGDHTAARLALEDSRDAPCGLLVRYTARTTRPVQHLIASYAAARNWSVVDLRAVLADADAPELPDHRYFHDYCHLSDRGIERAMAAVTDAVLDLPAGTTPVGGGLAAPARAFAQVHSASHLAFTGQPASRVSARLRAGLDAAPELATALAALRDILSAAQPRWTHLATETLEALPEAHDFLYALAGTRGLPAWLWVLRECLAVEIGAETTGDCAERMDLLGGGQPLPNWLDRCYHQATARGSSFPFPLRVPCPVILDITYRMPAARDGAGDAADVMFNGVPVAALPGRRRWTATAVTLPAEPARPGVNRIEIRWPIPSPDPQSRSSADAAALARGGLPFVLPLFGEICAAHVKPAQP